MLSQDCSGGFYYSKNLMSLLVIKKGAKNLAADHLSKLENPHEGDLEKKKINETFPLKTLGMISFHEDVFTDKKPLISSKLSIMDPPWDIMVMLKYGVTHRLSIVYHPQMSGQVEYLNHGLKRILERTVGKNQASWSDKLDDALWAFRTAFNTPIGCTPYKIVYEKACHLPIELEHKTYWALKHCNFDLKIDDFLGQAKNSLDWTIHRCQVFPYGTIELSQLDGPNCKVNGHRLKQYFGGDIPPMVVLHL
nr:hypothetical protein [Tanacetum cinerariifolium]